jgi:hypothetical protein
VWRTRKGLGLVIQAAVDGHPRADTRGLALCRDPSVALICNQKEVNMNSQFDELTKVLAQSGTRPTAGHPPVNCGAGPSFPQLLQLPASYGIGLRNAERPIEAWRVLLRRAWGIALSATTLYFGNAFAAELLVYNNSDATSSGSLRQAVNDNNAAGGGNTIVFSNTVTGTILLTNPAGQLLITKDVTIVGPGAKVLAISGNLAHRVFYVSNCTANISGCRGASKTGQVL